MSIIPDLEDILGYGEDLWKFGSDVVSGQLGAPTSIDRENLALQQEIADRNYGMQKRAYEFGLDQFEWQKESQEQAWAREDSAVQRRAADLEAAGMNPLMAAGGAAQSSGPISPQRSNPAPQQEFVRNPARPPSLEKALALITQAATIDKTLAEKTYIDSQKNSVDVVTSYNKGTALPRTMQEMAKWSKADYDKEIAFTENKIRKTQNVKEKVELEQRLHDLDYYQKAGLPTNAPPDQWERRLSLAERFINATLGKIEMKNEGRRDRGISNYEY